MSCRGFSIAALNHTTLYTVHKHLMWSMKVYTVSLLFSHFLVTSNLFCHSLIIWSRTTQSLFCPNNTDNWENVACACRNANHSLLPVAPCLNQLSHVLCGCTGATLEQCCPCLVLCVLSGEKGCDKAHLLLSEVLPGSHTPHTTESPVCSLSCPLILFIFLNCGTRAGQNKSRFWFLPLVLGCKYVIKETLQGFSIALPNLFVFIDSWIYKQGRTTMALKVLGLLVERKVI